MVLFSRAPCATRCTFYSFDMPTPPGPFEARHDTHVQLIFRYKVSCLLIFCFIFLQCLFNVYSFWMHFMLTFWNPSSLQRWTVNMPIWIICWNTLYSVMRVGALCILLCQNKLCIQLTLFVLKDIGMLFVDHHTFLAVVPAKNVKEIHKYRSYFCCALSLFHSPAPSFCRATKWTSLHTLHLYISSIMALYPFLLYLIYLLHNT